MTCKAHFILLAFLFLASAVFAQEAPQPDSKTAATVAKQEWSVSWDNRPSVRYGDRLRIDLRARLTTDLRRSGASTDERETATFDIARRRVGLSGVIADVADFQIERELADEGGWRDVYLDFRGMRRVDIQAGQFKLPFGLDENTSSTNLDFVYRSRAATLSPGRDPGVMAHGRAAWWLRYEGGVFFRDGDNGRDPFTVRLSGSSLTPAGRLVVQPFRSQESVFEDFHAGVAFTSSNTPPGIADFRGPSAVGRPIFRQEFGIEGPRRRLGFEMRWRPGPFGVQSEFVRVTAERRAQSIEDTDLPPIVSSAWYVQGTWVVTGEEKARGADEPMRPLFGGGLGSLEFGARLDSAGFSSLGDGEPTMGPRAETILPHRDRAVTFGVNWAPNRWMRVQANLVRDTMTISSSPFWSRVLRLRFAM